MYLIGSRRNFLSKLITSSSLGAILCVREAASAGAAQAKGDAKQDAQVYEPGGDVKAPKLVHYVEPEFSPSAKEAFVEGTVKISTVVSVEGKATSCKVVRGLNAEEDRTAVEALEQWTFRPGTKSDKPVNVRIDVEIDFHLL